MEDPQRKQLNPSISPSSDTYELEARASSSFKFFHALSTFTSRPELLLPNVRSTDLDWESIDSQHRICFNRQKCSGLFDFLYSTIYHQGKSFPSAEWGEMCGSLYNETISLWLQDSKYFEFDRLIHHKPKDSKMGWSSKVHESWDFRNQTVDVVPVLSPSQLWSYLPVTINAKYFVESQTVRFKVTQHLWRSDGEIRDSLEFYKTKVLPKIIQWMSDECNFGPPSLTRLRARPHSFVLNSYYWLFYDLLKFGPALKIKALWQESTDPVKFIHEDIGIAAYIGSFIYGKSDLYRSNNNSNSIDVVDFGCGNGLLCFFLSHLLNVFASSVSVVGFDIRRRKLWPKFLQELGTNKAMTHLLLQARQMDSSLPVPVQEPENNFSLIERTFEPHSMGDLISEYGSPTGKRERALWLIGNHSDELTPWIPVVARRLNATGFFIIPCCPFDYFKKYQRKGDLPGSSIYQNYMEYVCTIGDEYGYQPALDKLRIPSTKNICLIGIDCSRKFQPGDLPGRVEVIMDQLETDKEANSPSKFVPRTKESERESPKLNKTTAKEIVDKIFFLLLSDSEQTTSSGWHVGRQDVTLPEITNILSEDQRAMLKGKGNGLKTLVKSNRHIFKNDGNYVRIRIPTENDVECVNEFSRNRIKTRDCYFHVHHPQGCPLQNEVCTYKH